ncbi:NAD(P)/FAD-dependent oxidoreductase [Streptomyces sp. NPDC059850]|uniref:NAD(P)/FAD-dependent oxidoreductase n=1 Tax=Streptomyces sp. NPDC059850 TaxID=3346970 RepID=UPI00365885EF
MTSPGTAPSSVTVVGGGVVGLVCAHYLSAAGLRVTVLERDRLGSGASRGNAGEVCPDLVEPLAAPGVIGTALRGLHRPDSALAVHPSTSAALLRFLVRFGLRATARHYDRGASALGALAQGTFGLFEELEALGVDGDAHKDGFLFAFPSREYAAKALTAFRGLGAPIATGGLLTGAALADTEPALTEGARAGFVVDDQWSLDPGLFVDRLAERLRRQGVELVEGARVSAVTDRAGRTEVRTSAGTYRGDAVVVAAGIWSRELVRGLGVDIDLVAGKGYSFSVAAEPPPARLVHLGAAKVVLTPMGKRVRVAGTMEFERDPDRFRRRRVEAIVAAARPYLRHADWDDLQEEWVGPRPMTPDGLPLIGRVPGHSRVLLATGHNMLGLMLAPATGRLVAGLLTGDADPALSSAFAPVRCARRYPWRAHGNSPVNSPV